MMVINNKPKDGGIVQWGNNSLAHKVLVSHSFRKVCKRYIEGILAMAKFKALWTLHALPAQEHLGNLSPQDLFPCIESFRHSGHCSQGLSGPRGTVHLGLTHMMLLLKGMLNVRIVG